MPSPEPAPDRRQGARFVVQEHHARRLHWDFRLERAGVYVSWAVPRGLPYEPASKHLAVQTPDHPLDFGDFEGKIAPGEYGAGKVIIWDRGTYETETWTAREVKVVLAGERVRGRYVLIRTRGDDWIMRRMDPPSDPDWLPLPDPPRPMLATTGPMPAVDEQASWAYEPTWRGLRALARVAAGRITLTDRDRSEVTVRFPELRALGTGLGTTQVLLDGELVVLDAAGRPAPGRLRERRGAADDRAARRLATAHPATYVLFDLLHLDGRPTLELGYAGRRELLDGLALTGPAWQTVPSFGGDGPAVLAGARAQGLPGVVAKRLDGRYYPGRRSPLWRLVRVSGPDRRGRA